MGRGRIEHVLSASSHSLLYRDNFPLEKLLRIESTFIFQNDHRDSMQKKITIHRHNTETTHF